MLKTDKKKRKTGPKPGSAIGVKVATSATCAEVARVFGLGRNTVNEWVGCPRNDDGSYHLPTVIEWRISRAIEDRGEALVDGPKTESLERVRRAQAERIELQNAVTKNNLVPVDRLRESLLAYCSVLRRACEKLQRLFGRDAYDVLSEALDEAENHVRQRFLNDDDTYTAEN